MSKRYIILGSVGQMSGRGIASVCGSTVTVSVSDIEGELNLFFIADGERIDAGTIRGGVAKSFELAEKDAAKIDAVLIEKNGEVVIYGSSPVSVPTKQSVPECENSPKKLMPLGTDDGFLWVKIDDGRFADSCPMIRYILDNIAVIGRINDAGCYYFGKNGDKRAVAVPSAKGSENPFKHIAECARYINGCWTIGADLRERCFYSLID